MELSSKEKEIIFCNLLNGYPEFERSRHYLEQLSGVGSSENMLKVINKQEKLAYNLIKKFADEIGRKIPPYKQPKNVSRKINTKNKK